MRVRRQEKINIKLLIINGFIPWPINTVYMQTKSLAYSTTFELLLLILLATNMVIAIQCYAIAGTFRVRVQTIGYARIKYDIKKAIKKKETCYMRATKGLNDHKILWLILSTSSDVIISV